MKKDGTTTHSALLGEITMAAVPAMNKNDALNALLDSAPRVGEVLSKSSASSGNEADQRLMAIYDSCADEKERGLMTRRITAAVQARVSQTGRPIEQGAWDQAIQFAYLDSLAGIEDRKAIFDSASLSTGTNLHHDQLGINNSRAIVSFLGALAAPVIPFATAMPADIKTNRAKLVIVGTKAGTTTGRYAVGDSLDGTGGGLSYMTTNRYHTLVLNTGVYGGTLTEVQTDDVTCGAGSGNAKFLRGQGLLFVNGIMAGGESITNASNGTGSNGVTGSVVISGTTYTFTGTFNPDTGVAAITPSSALPGGTVVAFESSLDYERMPANLIPSINVVADNWDVYARPYRGSYTQTYDAFTQFRNELDIDGNSAGQMGLFKQISTERHNLALSRVLNIGKYYSQAYNMDWATKSVYRDRASLAKDLLSHFEALATDISIRTLGATSDYIVYVGKFGLSLLQALGGEYFVRSGSQASKIIHHKVGVLFNSYEVWFTPQVLSDTNTTTQMLMIGRAAEPARAPFIYGDAVAPIPVPFAVTSDFKGGVGYYGRGFNQQNPHLPSATGAGVVTITNIGL